MVARIVILAVASCFGQPGQNAYMAAKGLRGWERVLSTEPGGEGRVAWAHAAPTDDSFEWQQQE